MNYAVDEHVVADIACRVLRAAGLADRPWETVRQIPAAGARTGTLADRAGLDIDTVERRALPHCPAERIVVAPDCGLKYLPRDVAFGKMQAMAEGAAIVRRELG